MLLVGCAGNSTQSNKDSKEEEENIEETPKLEDGDYCADILYYNPKTGHRASYDLTVQVVDNSIEKIYFCNGGHLDHFDAPQLDENFSSDFISYEGVHWDVTVSETPCDPQENCNNEDMAIFEFGYLLKSLNITPAELKILERDLSLSPDDYVTLRQYKIIREYLNVVRAKAALTAEVESGYIADIHSIMVHGNTKCQIAIIKRYGKYYIMEVMGQDDCVMGATKFDSEDFNWQTVMIKPDPDMSAMRVYQMRLLESSGNLQYLKSKARTICTF